MNAHVAELFSRKNAAFPILLPYVVLLVKVLHENGFHRYRLFIKGLDSIPPITARAAAYPKVKICAI
jgi:hypothetical protein